MQAKLVSLNVSCCPDGDGIFIDVNGGPTQIVFAVTDCITGCEIILPSTIYDELRTAKPCLVMPIPNANCVGVNIGRFVNCVGVNKSPNVCDSDKQQTNEQPVQSDTVSCNNGDNLSSLDIVMSGGKIVSPPTVSMNKVVIIKITKCDLADEQSKDLSLTSCFDACRR